MMEPRLRILHLEDNKNDVEIVEATLTNGGINCEIVVVESRLDFLSAIEKGEMDLIISDYNLPSFNGLYALAMAKEICPKIPFIFVSGAIGEETAIETLKLGATDYVLKERLLRLVPAVHRARREVCEEELERANKKLKAMYEAQREFTSIVSHELRTPLTSIRLGVELVLTKRVGEINKKQEDILGDVKDSVDR